MGLAGMSSIKPRRGAAGLTKATPPPITPSNARLTKPELRKIRRLRDVASNPQVNFYDHGNNAANMNDSLDDVAQFLYKLKPLVNFTPPRHQTG